MKPAVKIAGLSAVIVACLVWMASYSHKSATAGDPMVHPAPVACAACGKAYPGELGREPGICKFCKRPDLWWALKCANCATIYPRKATPQPGEKMAVACPKCGATKTVSMLPADLPDK